jgi:hypothetical protein
MDQTTARKWVQIVNEANRHRLSELAYLYSLAQQRLNYLRLKKVNESINLPRNSPKDCPRIDIFVKTSPNSFTIEYLSRYRGNSPFSDCPVQKRLVELCADKAKLDFPKKFYGLIFDAPYVGVSVSVQPKSQFTPFTDEWVADQVLRNRLNIPDKPRYLLTIYQEQQKIALGLVPKWSFEKAARYPNIAEKILRHYAQWHNLPGRWNFEVTTGNYPWELSNPTGEKIKILCTKY